MYACDERWWRHHWDEVKSFRGEKWTQAHNDQTRKFAAEFDLRFMEGAGSPGLGRDKIHHGGNSGYQAVNLAYLFGAERIVLLGYDMQTTGGQAHFFGSHPHGLANGDYKSFIGRFDRLSQDLKSEGVEVINCTRETALHQFARGELDCVLSLSEQAPA